MICNHNRTAAACEECQHAAALADPRRAQFTREELRPNIGKDSGILPDGDNEPAVRSRRRTGTTAPPAADILP